ncbi:MAG: hypothetical protein FJZ00_06245, partial [Candidatus Sericytochromatia bacterium]|nr:hypothetical protein [Candidatus Tanganyikabacteria bacterium]
MYDAEFEHFLRGDPDPEEEAERDEMMLDAAIHLGGDRLVRFNGEGYFPVEVAGGDKNYLLLRVPRRAIMGLHV